MRRRSYRPLMGMIILALTSLVALGACGDEDSTDNTGGGTTNNAGGGTTNNAGGGTTNNAGGGTTNNAGGGTTNNAGGGTTNNTGGGTTNNDTTGGGTTGGGTTGGGTTEPANNATSNNDTGNNAPTNNAVGNNAAGEGVAFSEVAELLRLSCGGCHGANGSGEWQMEGGGNATDAAVRGSLEGIEADNGKLLIAPGAPQDSELYLRMVNTRRDKVMPPTGALPQAATDKVRDWIAAGAKFE